MDKMLAELKTEVDELHVLLQDPQPGISSWCLMVGKRWNRIACLWDPAVPEV